jgi:hypothetical protein
MKRHMQRAQATRRRNHEAGCRDGAHVNTAQANPNELIRYFDAVYALAEHVKPIILAPIPSPPAGPRPTTSG